MQGCNCFVNQSGGWVEFHRAKWHRRVTSATSKCVLIWDDGKLSRRGCVGRWSPKDTDLAMNLAALSSGLWRMTRAQWSDRPLFHFALDKWQRGLLPVARLPSSFRRPLFSPSCLLNMPSRAGGMKDLRCCLQNVALDLFLARFSDVMLFRGECLELKCYQPAREWNIFLLKAFFDPHLEV